MWTVKVFNPIGRLWGFYIAYNNKEVVIKQLCRKVESWYFKNAIKVSIANNDNRKSAIIKAKNCKLPFRIVGDSVFTKIISEM